MKENFDQTINLQELVELDARQGLPEELFLAISSLIPIANVDLFIRNDANQILLSWRDDPFYGKGWHIPGGCIRFKETMEDRIKKVAKSELNCEVQINEVPIAVRDVIIEKDSCEPKIRAHNLAVMFECFIEHDIDNGNKKENEAGYLKWFSKIPDNILKVHECYQDIFEKFDLV